jgi:hypothetical protein
MESNDLSFWTLTKCSSRDTITLKIKAIKLIISLLILNRQGKTVTYTENDGHIKIVLILKLLN